VDINEYASSQLPEVKEWIAAMNKLMIDGSCRVTSTVVSNSKRTDGKFSYASRKSKKTVCIINIGTSGCYISLRGNHFIHPNQTMTNNILDELPENMFSFVIKGTGCGLGTCITHDYMVNPDHKCVHGHAEVFTYKRQKSFRCKYGGYKFVLDKTTEFNILKKWINYEISWKPED
jgi:hypothetical protein